MADKDGCRRYFEAAAVLGEVTRARAEELVRELTGSGEAQRGQGQEWVEELVSRSRKAAADLLDLVRTQMSGQMQALGLDPEELASQAAEILRRSAGAGWRIAQDVSTGGRAPNGPKNAAPEKTAPKKAAAKKTAPKKAAGKNAAGGKKTAAKNAAPKKKKSASEARSRAARAAPAAR